VCVVGSVRSNDSLHQYDRRMNSLTVKRVINFFTSTKFGEIDFVRSLLQIVTVMID
jgi:hypothetical protein